MIQLNIIGINPNLCWEISHTSSWK